MTAAICVDPERPRDIIVGGERLSAPRRVHRLLTVMLAKPGKLIAHRELHSAMGWHHEDAHNCTKVAISHARAALRRHGEPARIETVWGEGYCLRVPA